MRGVLSHFPFFVHDLFPFLLTRTSAVHRDVILEVYANVLYAMGFNWVNRRFGASVSENVSRIRGNILQQYIAGYRAALGQTAALNGFECFDDTHVYNGTCSSAIYPLTVRYKAMETAPVAKLDQLVLGVEGQVCLGELNGGKRCEIILVDSAGSVLSFVWRSLRIDSF